MKRSILALVAAFAMFAAVPVGAQTEKAAPQSDGVSFGVQHAVAASASPSATLQKTVKGAKVKTDAPPHAAQKARAYVKSQPIETAYVFGTIPNWVTLTIHRADSGITEQYVSHNSRVNAGASAIAQLIGSAAGSPFIYVALSSDATAVAATDTTCPSEYSTNGLARKAATYGGYTAPSSLGGSASYTETASWTSTANTQAINKICALNAASSGTLGFETILGSTVTLNNGDTGNLTWTFNI